MDTNFSPIENYPFLSPFIFVENSKELKKQKNVLIKILNKNKRTLKIKGNHYQNYLNAHEKVFSKVIAEYF